MKSTLKLFHVDLKTNFPNVQHVTKLQKTLNLNKVEMRSLDILATIKVFIWCYLMVVDHTCADVKKSGL